ncbi:unnamed protein product [Citrullus colocynthis]|uniref:Uncharacterized protein n=1 Tax=Citrullus colocynthis TaxID=252529 RepID=A0ABP0XVM6_9ROSI
MRSAVEIFNKLVKTNSRNFKKSPANVLAPPSCISPPPFLLAKAILQPLLYLELKRHIETEAEQDLAGPMYESKREG